MALGRLQWRLLLPLRPALVHYMPAHTAQPQAPPYCIAHLCAPTHLQSFLERALSVLLSPLVFHFGDSLAQRSGQKLAQEFGLDGSSSPAAAHASARLLLVNEVAGLSTPRSLPPKVKVSLCGCVQAGWRQSGMVVTVKLLVLVLHPTALSHPTTAPQPHTPLTSPSACLGQMVGPLLVGGKAKPLPPALDTIMQRAGNAGVAYCSFGTAFRPANCDIVRGMAAALVALPMHSIWIVNASYFPGVFSCCVLLPFGGCRSAVAGC